MDVALDVAVTVTDAFPESDNGLTVSQDGMPVIVQLVFDVTVNVLFPPVPAKLSVTGDTVKDSNLACVTATVRVMPSPVTVISAFRSVVAVLAVVVTVTVPLFVPVDGLTVSQAADDSFSTVQLTLDETSNVFESAADVKVSEAGDRVT